MSNDPTVGQQTSTARTIRQWSAIIGKAPGTVGTWATKGWMAPEFTSAFDIRYFSEDAIRGAIEQQRAVHNAEADRMLNMLNRAARAAS